MFRHLNKMYFYEPGITTFLNVLLNSGFSSNVADIVIKQAQPNELVAAH